MQDPGVLVRLKNQNNLIPLECFFGPENNFHTQVTGKVIPHTEIVGKEAKNVLI